MPLSSEGTKVLYCTSSDPDFPSVNILSPDLRRYWIATGLCPQELTVKLGSATHPTGLKLICSGIRSIRVETAQEGSYIFGEAAVGELEDVGHVLQHWSSPLLDLGAHVKMIKVIVLSSWSEFFSIHSMHIDSSSPGLAATRKRFTELHRQGTGVNLLEVSIPRAEHNKDQSEPDAPKVSDHIKTWGT
mmetsp:Transcript_1024/g.2210  ORF Transcript_1024/g.2210 Transcript_1024/m.2210 type:complete len:188 (-) Transcript_1024:181-744(-)|eukprot:CAMPEP_0206429250 /NCGR_PEP_ID=MMETSP0324_2-20121206/6126_1 /ASSEMBLY_ACC=CAM_ASM_000836 /TAXON_ID=2866 /ORGANISM="Crypthecodinium cohnii, Strain Seligo" /LENGTH=187 /DNA_ID=CAMNT_0053894889 /DNA_START=98 /DNA_END=661 /DNA_ORIENTATION=-